MIKNIEYFENIIKLCSENDLYMQITYMSSVPEFEIEISGYTFKYYHKHVYDLKDEYNRIKEKYNEFLKPFKVR